MTTEDKELLLKDLCARLPYGVMVREDTVLYDDKNTTSYRVKKLSYVLIGKGFSRIRGFIHDYEYIYRPYLFPLSSMTEEQKEELKHEISKQTEILIERMKNDDCGIDCGKYHFHSLLELDWLLKNHFDFRGLIPKGLALDASGLNIY